MLKESFLTLKKHLGLTRIFFVIALEFVAEWFIYKDICARLGNIATLGGFVVFAFIFFIFCLVAVYLSFFGGDGEVWQKIFNYKAHSMSYAAVNIMRVFFWVAIIIFSGIFVVAMASGGNGFKPLIFFLLAVIFIVFAGQRDYFLSMNFRKIKCGDCGKSFLSVRCPYASCPHCGHCQPND